jgi:hypothetical protein
VARHADVGDQILDAAMIADALTQYMLCSRRRGRRGARADDGREPASFLTTPVHLRSAARCR